MLRTYRGVLQRRNEVLQSVNVLLWGGNVDLLTVDGVRGVEHGMLFRLAGLRTPDDGMLCRFVRDLRADSGILFPSHDILFPPSGVLTGDSVDLLTHSGVRTVNSGMRFLADGILCRVNVVLRAESVVRTVRNAGSDACRRASSPRPCGLCVMFGRSVVGRDAPRAPSRQWRLPSGARGATRPTDPQLLLRRCANARVAASITISPGMARSVRGGTADAVLRSAGLRPGWF